MLKAAVLSKMIIGALTKEGERLYYVMHNVNAESVHASIAT